MQSFYVSYSPNCFGKSKQLIGNNVLRIFLKVGFNVELMFLAQTDFILP